MSETNQQQIPKVVRWMQSLAERSQNDRTLRLFAAFFGTIMCTVILVALIDRILGLQSSIVRISLAFSLTIVVWSFTVGFYWLHPALSSEERTCLWRKNGSVFAWPLLVFLVPTWHSLPISSRFADTPGLNLLAIALFEITLILGLYVLPFLAGRFIGSKIHPQPLTGEANA